MASVMPRDNVERFEQLYARHRTAVYGFLEGLVGDAQVAEELTQAAFMALFRRLGRLGRELQPTIALYRLAYHVAQQHEWRPPWELLTRRSPAPAASDDLVAGLRALPLPERAALLLRDREGLSYEEIAETLDCSLGAVRVWLAQARMRLIGRPETSLCARAAALQSAGFDDRLEPEEHEWLDAHCRGCSSCAQRGTAYGALREGLRRLVRGSFSVAREAELFAAVRSGHSGGGRRAERISVWVGLLSLLIVGWSTLLLIARATALPDEPPPAAVPKPSPVPVVPRGTVYVLNQTSPGAISIVDGASHTLLRQVGLPFRPTSMAWDAATRRFYVARGAPAVTILDVETATILGEVPLRYPAWTHVLAPDGRSLFASHFTNLRVTQVDIARGETLREFETGARPSSVAVDPSGRWLFVGTASGTLLRFDVQTGRRVGSWAFDRAGEDSFVRVVVAVAPDGQAAYAAMLDVGQVVAIDLATGRVRQAKIRPGGTARAAVVSPDGARLLIGSTQDRSGTPGVVVLRTDKLTDISGSVERSGTGLAVSSDSKVLYLTHPGLGLLYAYDMETGQLLGATDVGNAPGPVLFVD